MAEDLNVRVQPTPINPIVIKGAIAFSAEHARIWAEGTDSEVEQLGGEHSAKGWAAATGEEGKAYTDEQIAIAKTEISGQIATASQGAVDTANTYTDEQVGLEASARTSADSTLQYNIDDEALARVAADNDLQGQIDALAASSDVTDIVGTYAELEAYDTTHLKDNDIIKVLDDSTHDDAPSYYRWDKETEEFTYIGSESASYTKAQADAKFLTQTDAASTYVSNSALATALADKASNADGTTIVDSGSAITTVAVREQRANAAIKEWVGTKAQYDAIVTKDENTLYTVTDEDDSAFLTVDSSLSSTSTNPVQNKVIYQALQNVDALPSQTGQSGKFLSTDGTSASWATVQTGGAPTLTWYTGNTGTTVTIASTSGADLVKIYKNGILLEPTADYSISGTTLTLVTALVATDKITLEVF